ncbi:MAG: hypothetical protein H7Y12_06810 [Sphingobacteriaceae bacterium]|nr:hypothetical protein [Cytophagaceae bacterium]
MKTRFFTLAVVALFALMLGCKKEKEAEPLPTITFTSAEDTFGGVQFITTATNANSYRWTFGDGTTDTTANPFHVFPKNGFFTVKVEATGPGGTTSFVLDVIVAGVRGRASFWKSSGTRSLELFVDDEFVGTVVINQTKAVTTCDAAGTVTISKLKEGTHTYLARETTVLIPKKYEGTFSVKGGECLPVKLL